MSHIMSFFGLEPKRLNEEVEKLKVGQLVMSDYKNINERYRITKLEQVGKRRAESGWLESVEGVICKCCGLGPKGFDDVCASWLLPAKRVTNRSKGTISKRC